MGWCWCLRLQDIGVKFEVLSVASFLGGRGVLGDVGNPGSVLGGGCDGGRCHSCNTSRQLRLIVVVCVAQGCGVVICVDVICGVGRACDIVMAAALRCRVVRCLSCCRSC